MYCLRCHIISMLSSKAEAYFILIFLVLTFFILVPLHLGQVIPKSLAIYYTSKRGSFFLYLRTTNNLKLYIQLII